ncbi:YciI family protein [Leptospira wolffii]|uniref:YciI family protein n=1 Tax=Leptospira wolffii TaxID=409998 RepID=A0ABV5BM86_9LEPT
MKEFMLLFRQPSYDYSKADPKDMEALAKKWKDWVGGVITDGPFVEIRERLGSFIIVNAESLEEATTLAHGCPAVDADGSVEIRPIYG